MEEKNCTKHGKALTQMCLAEDCKEDLFLCSECLESNVHKHSKTDLVKIGEIKTKLKEAWEPKQSIIEGYFKKTVTFYDNLRKEIIKMIDEDQKCVEGFLTKVKYHHLPYEANSQAYLQFMKEQYEQLDKSSILKLVNQAESGDLNKNLQKQKQVSNFMDLELKKVNDKVLTLKYVLLSKKLEGQLLVPNLSQESKVANNDQFVRIYSLFNSRKMLIRSANLIYRGSENDFSPKSFYNRCNGQLNCLAIVKTKSNKLVGGFSPLPFVHHDEEELTQQGIYEVDKSKRSFIFSITNLKSFSLKDNSRAIRYHKDQAGPSFGEDLDIDKVVTSSIGHSYQGTEGVSVDSLAAKVFLLEAVQAQIKEFQIWQLSF